MKQILQVSDTELPTCTTLVSLGKKAITYSIMGNFGVMNNLAMLAVNLFVNFILNNNRLQLMQVVISLLSSPPQKANM